MLRHDFAWTCEHTARYAVDSFRFMYVLSIEIGDVLLYVVVNASSVSENSEYFKWIISIESQQINGKQTAQYQPVWLAFRLRCDSLGTHKTRIWRSRYRYVGNKVNHTHTHAHTHTFTTNTRAKFGPHFSNNSNKKKKQISNSSLQS